MLWLGWWLIASGIALFALFADREDAGGILVLVGAPLLIIAYVYQLVVRFRCWAALPPGGTTVTPGKAVGFLFIPIFNMYWQFIAYARLATEARASFQVVQAGDCPISRPLSIAYCILNLLAFIPYLGLVATFVNQIILTVLVHQWSAFLRVTARPSPR